MDKAIAVSTAGCSRQGQYLVAQSNIAAANTAKMEFMEIVQDFICEIINVGNVPLR
jgi:hypothetical protein